MGRDASTARGSAAPINDVVTKAVAAVMKNTAKPPRKRPAPPAGAPRGDHAAAYKPPSKGLLAATPVVTEHTHGQAHAGPDTRTPRDFLPADYGSSLHPPRATPAERRAYKAGHVYPFGSAGVAVDALLRLAGSSDQLQPQAHGPAQREDVFAPAELAAGAVGKQLRSEADHPLRHPGNTALDASALLAGGAGLFARGAEAARAVSAADEGSRAAAALDALTTRPPPSALTPARFVPDESGLRRVRHLGGEVQPRQSPNPVAAAVQHIVDRLSEQHPHAPVVGAVPRVARQARRGVAVDEHRAAAAAVPFGEASRHIKVGSPEDVALGRLVSYGHEDPAGAALRVDQEIATHRARAALPVAKPRYETRSGHRVLVQPKGTISPTEHRDLTATADALEAARPHVANPSPLLATAAREGAGLSHLAEGTRLDTAGLTPETAARNVDRRARQAAGAQYVTAHDARQEITALKRHSRALDAEEARVRRKVKQTVKVGLSDQTVAALKDANTAAETASRTRAGLADDVAAAERKLAREEGRLKGKHLVKAAEGKGSNAVIVTSARSVLSARRQVADAKKLLRDATREGKTVAARQAALHTKAQAEQARLTTIQTRALSGHAEALGRIAKQRQAVNERLFQLPTETGTFVGAENVKAGKGAAFLPSLPRKARVPVARVGGSTGRVGKLIRHAEGTLFTQGREELSGRRLVNSHFLSTAKYVNTQQKVADLHKLTVPLEPGSTLRPGHRLWNPDGLKVARRLREEAPPGVIETMTPGEVEQTVRELHQRDLSIHDALFPQTDGGQEGLRQVDERLAKAYFPTPSLPADGVAGVTRDLLDATNNITRAALIYLNPSYIPRNYVGNLAFLALHQGVFAPQNLIRATRTLGDLPVETLHRIDVEVQGGAARGMLEASTGRHTIMTEKIAGFQNRMADQGPRRAAWLHEAAVKGYRTPAEIDALLTQPKLRGALNQVSLDSRRAMVDFGDLTPFERKVVQRAVFIYPWLKGATRYVKDLVVDRPVAAAVAGHGLTAEQQLQQKAYGHIDPLLGQDVIPLGHTAPGVLRTMNLQSLSPVGQGLDVGRAAKAAVFGGGSKADLLSQFVQPGLAAGIDAAYHLHDSNGRRSAAGIFLQDLLGTPARPSFPAANLAATALTKPSADPGKHDYLPEGARGHGLLHALETVASQALLGSARPRQLNVAAAQAKAPMGAGQREANTWLGYYHKLGLAPSAREQQIIGFIQIRAEERHKTGATVMDGYKADLNTLARLGLMTKAEAKRQADFAKGLNDTDLASLRRLLPQPWATTDEMRGIERAAKNG